MSRFLPFLPRKVLSLAITLVLAGMPSLVLAQTRPQPMPPRQNSDMPRPRNDTLSETVRLVERDTRGEVLSAERVQYDGRDMHRVKVVEDDGRVRVYLREPDPRGRGGERRDPSPLAMPMPPTSVPDVPTRDDDD